jgi:aminopeptidase N
VTIDPELGLLAKIECDLPSEMLYAQLADRLDVVARLSACAQLATRKDGVTVGKLKEILEKDSFYGARIQAAESLRLIHTEAALEALIAGSGQSDARVRQHVYGEIGKFFDPLAQKTLTECLAHERNPAVIEWAIEGLGPYHEKAVYEALLRVLHSDSYKQRVAVAAFSAVQRQEDPGFVKPLMELLSSQEQSFNSDDFVKGLTTLAYIDRYEKPRDEVRNFVSRYLNHKRESMQIGAIRALGSLEDPEALAALQTFADSASDTPQQREAQWAISSIRWNNKPNDNLKDMRQEVLDLHKASREQKRELEELKKRLEAYEKRGRASAKSAKGAPALSGRGKPGARVK